MDKGVVDILVKLMDTKLEIGSSVSIFNSYSDLLCRFEKKVVFCNWKAK